MFRTWLLTFVMTSIAHSCFCTVSGCPALGGKTGPVFLGTVIEVTDIPGTGKFEFLNSRKARIQVNESFGGIAADTKEVSVLTGRGGGDCGIPFTAGEQYVVHRAIGDDGAVRAGICSFTKKLEDAGTDLRILRQLRDGNPLPTIVGQIARIDRNFEGPLGSHAPEPLPQTLVRVKSDGGTYQAEADSEGIFAFYNLPTGKYEFAPDLPAGTTLSWFIGSDSPLVSFEVRAGQCQMKDIEVFASGSIAGRILDSNNKPLTEGFAYIVPADGRPLSKETALYWDGQNKKDYFQFIHISPGKYMIVVNPDDARKPEFPYRRTFYPNSHDLSSAGIVTLSGGERIEGVDIHLDPPFAQRHLKVRVTWTDGRLIQDFVYVKARGTANPGLESDAHQPDLKASLLDLIIFPEERYEIEAQLTCRYADKNSMGPGAELTSNKVFLARGDDRTEVLLTIPGTGCPELAGRERLTDR
jgi:hypothetical protein